MIVSIGDTSIASFHDGLKGNRNAHAVNGTDGEASLDRFGWLLVSFSKRYKQPTNPAGSDR